jgi:hypothetical protein
VKRFLLGAASGVLAALIGVGVWVTVADHLRPRLVQEVCDPGADSAPLCVQLRDDGTPGGVLWVAHKDPDFGPRVTYAASPFTDLEFGTAEQIDVTFEPDQIVVRGNEGSELILTEEFYALD